MVEVIGSFGGGGDRGGGGGARAVGRQVGCGCRRGGIRGGVGAVGRQW